MPPPMMPGEEGPGMPPMMPGEEESGMPPMMPGEEESGMMPPMMPGDEAIGMLAPLPTPPPVNPMDADTLNQWIGICMELCTCQDNSCDCNDPSNPNFGACINLITALALICQNDPMSIPTQFCPLDF